MRYVRFRDEDGDIRAGEWETDGIHAYAGPDRLTLGDVYSPEAVDLLPPCSPSKIVCIGLNYADHAAEQDEDVPDRPMLFLKPPNTVAGPGDDVTLPAGKERIDHEAELGVVVGERARHVSADEAMDHVAGFTCLDDLSNRDDQRVEQNWVRGKSFDNSAPVGPVMAAPEHLPEGATIEVTQNGEVVQSSSLDDLIFEVPELIEEITRLVTLEEGDVVSTGTPAGVGPISDGDTVAVSIEGVGTLSNEFNSTEFTGDTTHDFVPNQ